MARTTGKKTVHYLQRARVCRAKLLKRVDAETLHELRTSLRHLEAALRLEKSLLRKERFKDERARIKYLLSLTGPLREEDVVARILLEAGLPAKKESASQRRQREKAFQVILASPLFEAGFREMAVWLEPGKKKSRRKMQSAFKKEIKRLVKFLEAFHRQGLSRKNLHHLRIQAKRLRYDLEQFEFLHPSHRKKLLKAVHRVHDSLGQLRDLQTAEKGLGTLKTNPLTALEQKKIREAASDISRLETLVR